LLEYRVSDGGTLEPPVLASSFGLVTPAGQVSRSGYLFQIWLPAAAAGGKVAGVAEDSGGGKLTAPYPSPDNSEVLWCCYAWPVEAPATGRRCFFINQYGDILQTANTGADAYSGTSSAPTCYAVYSSPNDMNSALGIDGTAANDGNTWTVLR
jgi:hypothetical protein